MKIVFVIDEINNTNNGTAVSANRFATQLKELGHEVRIVAIDATGDNSYQLERRKIFIASKVAARHKFYFAKPNKDIFRQAFEGADIVHAFTPFKVSRVAQKVAKQMGIAFSAAFHVHPQNIIYGAKLRFVGWPLSKFLFWRWRARLYKKVRYVHAPTEFAAQEMRYHRYKNNIVVISNGVNDIFVPKEILQAKVDSKCACVSCATFSCAHSTLPLLIKQGLIKGLLTEEDCLPKNSIQADVGQSKENGDQTDNFLESGGQANSSVVYSEQSKRHHTSVVYDRRREECPVSATNNVLCTVSEGDDCVDGSGLLQSSLIENERPLIVDSYAPMMPNDEYSHYSNSLTDVQIDCSLTGFNAVEDLQVEPSIVDALSLSNVASMSSDEESLLHSFFVASIPVESEVTVNSSVVDGRQVQQVLPVEADGYFRIISVGRLSPEKRQDLIIEAVAQSKYRDKIKLDLWGNGPKLKKLQRLVSRLKLHEQVSFSTVKLGRNFTHEELLAILHNSDLYVHAAEIEIEGITCLEAIAAGVPCIISNARKSATSYFSVGPQCVFEAGNPASLADKIDNMIANADILTNTRLQYIEKREQFTLLRSVKRFEIMLEDAIHHNKVSKIAKIQVNKKYTKKVRYIWFRKIFGKMFYYAIAPILWFIHTTFFGLKVIGRKHLLWLARKRRGAVTVSNHVHPFDCTMVAQAGLPKVLTYTSQPSNFKIPVAGQILSALTIIPTPSSTVQSQIFFDELIKKVNKGKFVHFFPEGKLDMYSQNIRDFKRGAFYLATIANAPIVPMCFVYKPRKNPKRRPKIVLKVSNAIYPDYSFDDREDTIDKLQSSVLAAMIQLQNNWNKMCHGRLE